jgi:hypothetical protein
MQPLVTDRGAFDKRGPGFGVKVPNLDGVLGDPLAQLDRLLRRTECRSDTLDLLRRGVVPTANFANCHVLSFLEGSCLPPSSHPVLAVISKGPKRRSAYSLTAWSKARWAHIRQFLVLVPSRHSTDFYRRFSDNHQKTRLRL